MQQSLASCKYLSPTRLEHHLEVRSDSKAPCRCSATMKSAMDVCSISARPSSYSPGGKLVWICSSNQPLPYSALRM